MISDTKETEEEFLEEDVFVKNMYIKCRNLFKNVYCRRNEIDTIRILQDCPERALGFLFSVEICIVH